MLAPRWIRFALPPMFAPDVHSRRSPRFLCCPCLVSSAVFAGSFRPLSRWFLFVLSACGPVQDGGGERAVVPPDTLPFAYASEPAIEADPADAAEKARQIAAAVDASPAAGLVLSMYATEDPDRGSRRH